jgi:hypothetical protein
MLVKLSSGLSN